MRLERDVYFDIKRRQLDVYRQSRSLCSALQGKAAHNEHDLSQPHNFPWKKNTEFPCPIVLTGSIYHPEEGCFVYLATEINPNSKIFSCQLTLLVYYGLEQEQGHTASAGTLRTSQTRTSRSAHPERAKR